MKYFFKGKTAIYAIDHGIKQLFPFLDQNGKLFFFLQIENKNRSDVHRTNSGSDRVPTLSLQFCDEHLAISEGNTLISNVYPHI